MKYIWKKARNLCIYSIIVVVHTILIMCRDIRIICKYLKLKRSCPVAITEIFFPWTSRLLIGYIVFLLSTILLRLDSLHEVPNILEEFLIPIINEAPILLVSIYLVSAIDRTITHYIKPPNLYTAIACLELKNWRRLDHIFGNDYVKMDDVSRALQGDACLPRKFNDLCVHKREALNRDFEAFKQFKQETGFSDPYIDLKCLQWLILKAKN